MNGCIGLTAMAVVSAALMASSLGTAWKFDGRRKRITRRVGLLGRNTNARKWAGLRVDSTKVSTFADVQLKMVLVDATGHPGLEITTWSRREIDRAQVDALATAIRQTMGWE
jgi:ABC-type xylose transport system permease subunit